MRFSDASSKSAIVTRFLAATSFPDHAPRQEWQDGHLLDQDTPSAPAGITKPGGRSEAQERAYVVLGCDSSESLTGSKEGQICRSHSHGRDGRAFWSGEGSVTAHREEEILSAGPHRRSVSQ
jgi:hypothetical protein